METPISTAAEKPQESAMMRKVREMLGEWRAEKDAAISAGEAENRELRAERDYWRDAAGRGEG